MNLEEYLRLAEEEKTKYLANEGTNIQNEDPFVRKLLKAFQNKELTEKSMAALKVLVDGEPVNVNPLFEIPKSEMRLYFIDNYYFQSMEELLQFCKVNRLSTKRLGF